MALSNSSDIPGVCMDGVYGIIYKSVPKSTYTSDFSVTRGSGYGLLAVGSKIGRLSVGSSKGIFASGLNRS